MSQRLIKPDDLSPLTDQNWVSEIMTDISNQKNGAEPQDGCGTKPWPGLSKRVEILRLSEIADDTQVVRDHLEQISVAG